MQEIKFPQWLFECGPRQGKKVLANGLDWMSYFAGSSKRHHEILISCIYLKVLHQVDTKTGVKCPEDFLRYS